jgi:hypothetical protein
MEKPKIIYQILACLDTGKEVVDETDNKEEARFLMKEYQIAFKRPCLCRMKVKREEK